MNQSMMTTMASIPFDLGKGPMMSILISYHGESLVDVALPLFSNAELYFAST